MSHPVHTDSIALVQLNDIAIGIANQDPLRCGPEVVGAATQRDAGRLKPLLCRHDVGAPECEVRDSRVPFGYIHQDIRLARVRRVEHEVQLQARGMIEDRNGLRIDGPAVFVNPSNW